MTEWQPIETAPKDGTRVLIYYPTLGETHICGFADGCWQSGIWSSPRIEPTYWQHEPAPPTGSPTNKEQST